MNDGAVSDEFKPTRWWQVRDNKGNLWCETSVKSEAVESMRPTDTLHRLYERTEMEWREEE